MKRYGKHITPDTIGTILCFGLFVAFMALLPVLVRVP